MHPMNGSMSNQIKAYVSWSVYVKTSNKRKLKSTHLPPITSALEGLEFDWQIETETENPGLFRLMNYQNLAGDTVEQLIVPVLRRAYRLHTDWRISGLEDLASGELKHVVGRCDIRTPSPRPPSLESMVFEIERGRVLPMRRDGGWPIVDVPPQTSPQKPGQLGWPDGEGTLLR